MGHIQPPCSSLDHYKLWRSGSRAGLYLQARYGGKLVEQSKESVTLLPCLVDWARVPALHLLQARGGIGGGGRQQKSRLGLLITASVAACGEGQQAVWGGYMRADARQRCSGGRRTRTTRRGYSTALHAGKTEAAVFQDQDLSNSGRGAACVHVDKCLICL